MKSRHALALLVIALAAAAVLALLAIDHRVPPRSPVELVPTTWKTAREAPMHVRHVGEQKIACSECHERPDAAPTFAACAKCHQNETGKHHHGSAESPTSCLSCHAFGLKAAATCNECHAKANRAPGVPALEHHAGTALPCGSCHSVHGQQQAVLADCTNCHATSAVHGRFAADSNAHTTERAPTVQDASTNVDVDGAVLAFLRGTSSGLVNHKARAPEGRAGLDASLPDDPRQATRGQVCTACHAPHSGKEAARAACEGCHVGTHGAEYGAKAVAPRGKGIAGHDACTTCHEPHRARRADVRACKTCHADHRIAETSTGHQACASCHTPHAPGEAKRSCATSCHSDVTVLAAPRVAAHAECSSCHDPHRPEVSAERACVGCHENTKPSHPAIASAKGSRTCTGCHAPHGKKLDGDVARANAHLGASNATSCTTCHAKLKDDHAAHGKNVTCTQCHTPHAFQLAGDGTKLCARCHETTHAKTAARPGHASCNTCHGAAHEPVAKPSCGGCHLEETKSAHAGHAKCTSCHDAHSGDLGGRKACTSCHENKQNALHAHATAQSCASCHRAHGPKGVASPAPCASCHARPSLAGLHSVGGHAPCESCHSAHTTPRSDRATCTAGCHADRLDHQPQAKVCKGCHLFRR